MALAVLAVVSLIVTGCGDDDDATTGTPEPTTEPTPTATPEPTPTAEPSPTATSEPTPTGTAEPSATATPDPTPTDATDVLVYFLDGTRLVVGGRIAEDVGVATAAVKGLLDGPQGLEDDLGWSSEIPAGTTLNGIVVADGTATVDLSAEFESGGGSLSVISRVAQIVFTLTQFPTVDEVDISIDGVPDDAIGGEGFQGQDLTRNDFLVASFVDAPVPLILVESPFVGEAVDRPLVISGLSNTFEANVLYQVTDTDGIIVVDSFTTATAGNGTWGTFEITLDIGDIPAFAREGIASVFVFEESARDGSQVNLVEVPVVIGPQWLSP
jgi:hypothetical protein